MKPSWRDWGANCPSIAKSASALARRSPSSNAGPPQPPLSLRCATGCSAIRGGVTGVLGVLPPPLRFGGAREGEGAVSPRPKAPEERRRSGASTAPALTRSPATTTGGVVWLPSQVTRVGVVRGGPEASRV